MNTNKNMEITLKLNHLRDLWQEFCEQHTKLYEVTCDEYLHLMSSDMDQLEITIKEKELVIQEIDQLDHYRNDLISELSDLLEIERPKKIATLLNLDLVDERISEDIEKYNLVLLDIIEKIVEQNKKNQFFLNKAIHSLNELKESFSGKVNYSTYSANGTKSSSKIY